MERNNFLNLFFVSKGQKVAKTLNMRMTPIAALVMGSVNQFSGAVAQDLLDYEVFDNSTDYEATDSEWMKENCPIQCNDGSCVAKSQICDGKHNCVDGKDEQNCINDDEENEDSKKRNNQVPYGPNRTLGGPSSNVNKMRGRYPFFAPTENMYAGFNEVAYKVFQRKNRRIISYISKQQTSNSQRLEQMMKMMFYMTDGKVSMPEFMSYGCHCNSDSSGRGTPQDDADTACSKNAGCRKCAMADYDCDQNTQYIVNGAIAGRTDALSCVNRPDTCSRALCECDLQLIRDIISFSTTGQWQKSLHAYYGFSQSECVASSGSDSLSARSLAASASGSSSGPQCCGNYPHRQPINGEGRQCCGVKSYDKTYFECCSDQVIVPIGSC